MESGEPEMRRIIVPAALVLVGLGAAFALLGSGTPRGGGTPGHAERPHDPAAPHRSSAPPRPEVIATDRLRVRVVALTDALVQPWALAFLPGGDMLITERGGRLRLMHDGRLSPVAIGGVPPVDTRQQDGLMDVALHPRFALNRIIYFTYSKSGAQGDTTVLANARFDGATLTGARDLFVADAWDAHGGNSGSRIAFGVDGTIYMSVGDRHGQTPAQDLGTHKGKILRLNDDGTIPLDNPFFGRQDARPEIFAYGVRNPQGLFVDPLTGTIWEHEHGPRGGDELNVIARGHNYGWPAITYGINYNGTIVSKDTVRKGMDQPIVHWTPSISPSGLTIYSGDRFPAWRGNVFLGALSGLDLRRLELQNGRVTHQEVIRVVARGTRRIRDVRQGPDGLRYVLTDSDALLRLEPELSLPGESDLQAEFQKIYDRATEAAVKARTLGDLDALRDWLDAADCVYTDFGRSPRNWSEQRTSAAAELGTPLLSLTSRIQTLQQDDPTTVATTAMVKGLARIVDGEGRFGAPGDAHDVETTATVRDVWTKSPSGWRRRSHTKIVGNAVTAIDGRPQR
jgi:aldose sugar dehydrogenase